MRCPKCGYNSFDYLDSCKKCGKDLVEFKQRYGLKGILLPGTFAAAGAIAQDEFSDADAAELTGAAVAAATAKTAASTESEVAAPEPVTASDDAADFDFDFMGDSSEDDDDLSFDELFEDVPDDEDVEEALEAPKPKQQPAAVDAEAETPEPAAELTESDDAFSFDRSDADDEQAEELESDFGFDPEDLDFELENFESEETKKRQDAPEGSGEGPQDPFDLPESSPSVGAPGNEIAAVIPPPAPVAGGDPGVTVTRDDAPEELAADRESGSLTNGPLPDRSDFLSEAPAPAQTGASTEKTAADSTMAMPASAAEPLFPPLSNRCLAFCYDVAILLIAGLCFLIAGEMAQSGSTNFLPSTETLINLAIPYFLILFFLIFSYYTLFHFLAGQTPGEMLTGLRVETVEGGALSLAQAFLRSVGSLVQLLPLGLGLLAMVVRPDRRGWNDQFAGTRVVIAAARKLPHP